MKRHIAFFTTVALCAAGFNLSNTTSAAPPRLLPFQGRLTDASGAAVPDSAKVVQFKIFDAPTGGTAVWNGEVQKVTVNGGLVSTLLGSKADLSAVDFNQALYLEITVDSNADNQITAADPPLLPRQSILPAVFAVEAQSARDSEKLGGFDWSAVFNNGSPAKGKIAGSKLADASVTTAQLSANAVTSTELAPNAVTTSEILDGSVTSGKILNGTILYEDLSSTLHSRTGLPGTVVAYAGATVPPNSGWLLCDGHEEPINSFPELAAVLGTKYGVPVLNPAGTHFKLPDYRGRFLRGIEDPDGAGGVAAPNPPRDPDVAARTAMATGGNTAGAVGSVQADEIKSHSHYLRGVESNPGPNQPFGIITDNGYGLQVQRWAPIDLSSALDPAGGNESRPKNAYVNYIIKY